MQSLQTASGYVRELHSTNLGAAGQFSLPPKGLEEGVLHVLSGHNLRHKSVIQAQKRAANCLRHRWNAILGAADNVQLICSHSDMLTKYLHRIRHRIRHRILYIVYDFVCIHDVVYDVVYYTSYTTSYTMSYAISFFTTTEIYSAGLTAPASRLRFRVSAPLSLES